jgi:hypothetical protein
LYRRRPKGIGPKVAIACRARQKQTKNSPGIAAPR